MADQTPTHHVQSGIPGALNVAGAVLGQAARDGKLPPWALVVITALSAVLGTGILAQFLPPVAGAPAVAAAPVGPVLNEDGKVVLTLEQFQDYALRWRKQGQQQALRDLAKDIHVDPSPENLLNIIAGMVLGAEPALPAPASAPADEVTP